MLFPAHLALLQLPILARLVSAAALPIPSDADGVALLETRAGEHPPARNGAPIKDVYFDYTISPELEQIGEQDCLAILCGGRPDEWQRDAVNKHVTAHRRQAGATDRPFGGSDAAVRARFIYRPDPIMNSLEEVPFAATSQGGSGMLDSQGDPAENFDVNYHALGFPATLRGQTHQAWSLSHAYGNQPAGGQPGDLTGVKWAKPGYNVATDGWFRPHFHSNANTCILLEGYRKGTTTDADRRRFCKSPPINRLDPKGTGMMKVSTKGQRNAYKHYDFANGRLY